jgi:hypothetical protein
MAGSQAPEVIPPNVISTCSKKTVLLVLRIQYPDSIKVASGNLDNVLKEIDQVSGLTVVRELATKVKHAGSVCLDR